MNPSIIPIIVINIIVFLMPKSELIFSNGRSSVVLFFCQLYLEESLLKMYVLLIKLLQIGLELYKFPQTEMSN